MPTIEELIKTKPIKDYHSRAALNIMFTGNWMQNMMNQTLKPYDLTEQQYNVLRILRGQKGETMNLYEIQDRMIQKMSNVSRLIDKLLDKGLVERKECKENRRRVDIYITPKGLQTLDDIEPAVREVFRVLNNNMSKEDAKLLAELLDKIRGEK